MTYTMEPEGTSGNGNQRQLGIVMPTDLYKDVVKASADANTSISVWVRNACRQRLANPPAEVEEAALPDGAELPSATRTAAQGAAKTAKK